MALRTYLLADAPQVAGSAEPTATQVAKRGGSAEPTATKVEVLVADVGLACCAVEFAAAVARGLLVPAPLADGGASSSSDGTPVTTVLVVSGTVTEALLPDILRAWEALPDPKAALSYGACANSGGPYWDSYAVAQGVDRVIPVKQYVPGCPPRPEALVAALRDLGRESGPEPREAGS